MEDAKLCFTSNVLVRSINKRTGKTIEKTYSNRITKTMLLGIARLMYGDFSIVTTEQASSYTPRYLALGGYKEDDPTPVYPQDAASVNAIKLTNELTGGSQNRIEISSKTISNEFANEYVKITMKMFVPNSTLSDNYMINEAGLFSTLTGDTCLARVGFNDIKKDNDTTIDIIWDVTIRSVVKEETT